MALAEELDMTLDAVLDEMRAGCHRAAAVGFDVYEAEVATECGLSVEELRRQAEPLAKWMT